MLTWTLTDSSVASSVIEDKGCHTSHTGIYVKFLLGLKVNPKHYRKFTKLRITV